MYIRITVVFPPCPNFLRPAYPYQGCQLSLNAGHAPWRLFLPATGSFFVFTDSSLRSSAPFGGRFLMIFSFRHTSSGAGRQPPIVSHQLCCVICRPGLQDHVKSPDQLACHRDHRLHLLQEILIPCRVILMDCSELPTVAHHAYCRFVQYISQLFPPAIADITFPFILTRLILYDRISSHLLELFWVIEALNIPTSATNPITVLILRP